MEDVKGVLLIEFEFEFTVVLVVVGRVVLEVEAEATAEDSFVIELALVGNGADAGVELVCVPWFGVEEPGCRCESGGA